MDLNSLMSLFGENEVGAMSNKLGVDKAQTASVLQGAVPAILSALQGNAQGKKGEKSLFNALSKDHDGSILDNLTGFIDNPESGNGKGILKHTLGSRRTSVEGMLSAKSGMDSGSIGKILEMAAPVIMGFLGKQQTQNNVSQSGIGSLISSVLGGNDSNSGGGMDIGDIASMFIGKKKGGIAGFLGGLLGR
mgnify:CR=1 FL=1